MYNDIDFHNMIDSNGNKKSYFTNHDDLNIVLDEMMGSHRFQDSFTGHSFWISLGDGIESVIQAEFTQSSDPLNVTFTRVTSVPEPATLAIFSLAMIGLASRRFKS